MIVFRFDGDAQTKGESWQLFDGLFVRLKSCPNPVVRTDSVSSNVTRPWRTGMCSGDDGEMAAGATMERDLEAPVVVSRVAPGRVLSVDMLRGITIALMILVNDPGDWNHLFPQLDHAQWSGWTLTDTVFPTFLFLIGASLVFSLEGRAAKGNCRKTQAGHLFLRSAKIFALDLALAYFPRMHWTHLRLYGVLTRIALCYLLAGLVLLMTRRVRVLVAIVAALLIGYWVLLRWVPVPGAGMPVRNVPLLDPVQNLTAWLDRVGLVWTQRWLHTGRLYKQTSDPEGLLSTLPAVASVLIGSLVGIFLRRPEWGTGEGSRNRMRGGMIAFGGLMFVAGSVWARWFPVNKNLWTSSYVLVMAGIATVVLALLNWLVDGRPNPFPKWLQVFSFPWFVFGSNAIAAFVISEVIVKTMLYFKITDADGDRHPLWEMTYDHVFARHGSNEWTSLAFGLSFVVVCFVPVWIMWRNKIFLKV
jgi:predicted acyltransferase